MSTRPTPSSGGFAVPRARRFASLASVISAASVFGLTYGLVAPLIAAHFARMGHSEWLIGANAAMHAAGVLLIASALPALASRFSARGLIVSALALSAAVIAAFPHMPLVWLWFPLRVLLGMASETLFVLTETWTNSLCESATRGRTMATYTAAQSLGFAAGPLLLSLVGTGPSAYLVGAGVAALAVVPLLGPWLIPPAPVQPTQGAQRQYWRLAPIALGAQCLTAGVETAGLSFIALYATGLGWGEKEALHLVSALMLGAIVLQFPIGQLADRMNPRRLALVLALMSAAGALAWPWALGIHWLAYVMIFVWGGLFVGIYTIMLMIVGSRFEGAELVGIYAVMSIAWGGGALLGPLLVGVAMDLAPSVGLPFAVALACMVFAGGLLIARSKA